MFLFIQMLWMMVPIVVVVVIVVGVDIVEVIEVIVANVIEIKVIGVLVAIVGVNCGVNGHCDISLEMVAAIVVAIVVAIVGVNCGLDLEVMDRLWWIPLVLVGSTVVLFSFAESSSNVGFHSGSDSEGFRIDFREGLYDGPRGGGSGVFGGRAATESFEVRKV